MTDTRRRSCAIGCTRCYYCGSWVPMAHEHDHYPIPRSIGGKAVVTACLNCHTLKDRLHLSEWPTAMFAEALSQIGAGVIIDTFTDQGRILDMPDVPLAALIAIEHDFPTWRTEGRLLYAKFRTLAERWAATP